MMTQTPHQIRGGLLAASLSLACTLASHAQTGPPPAVGPPAQNVIPATPATPVKVVPRTSNGQSPLAQLGLSTGSVHKIGVGLGVAKFRTLKVGVGGWISFECMEDNKAGWIPGEKYWINMSNVVFISAPFVTAPKTTVAPSAPAKPKGK